MVTHSSILAWRIQWTEESGGLQSMGLQRVRHNWSDLAHVHKGILGHMQNKSDSCKIPGFLMSFRWDGWWCVCLDNMGPARGTYSKDCYCLCLDHPHSLQTLVHEAVESQDRNSNSPEELVASTSSLLHRVLMVHPREGDDTPPQCSCLESPNGWRSVVGCSPWGLEELDTTERLHFHFSLSCIGEGNGNPLQCSCLENPRDGGAWWAAIYGVVQSRTQLKRLSSSSSSSIAVYPGRQFPEGGRGGEKHTIRSIWGFGTKMGMLSIWSLSVVLCSLCPIG